MPTPHESLMKWLDSVVGKTKSEVYSFFHPREAALREASDIEARNRADILGYYLPQQEMRRDPHSRLIEGPGPQQNFTMNMPTTEDIFGLVDLPLGAAAGLIGGPGRFKLGKIMKELEGLGSSDAVNWIKQAIKEGKSEREILEEAGPMVTAARFRSKVKDQLMQPEEFTARSEWERLFAEKMGRPPSDEEVLGVFGKSMGDREYIERTLKSQKENYVKQHPDADVEGIDAEIDGILKEFDKQQVRDELVSRTKAIEPDAITRKEQDYADLERGLSADEVQQAWDEGTALSEKHRLEDQAIIDQGYHKISDSNVFVRKPGGAHPTDLGATPLEPPIEAMPTDWRTTWPSGQKPTAENINDFIDTRVREYFEDLPPGVERPDYKDMWAETYQELLDHWKATDPDLYKKYKFYDAPKSDQPSFKLYGQLWRNKIDEAGGMDNFLGIIGGGRIEPDEVLAPGETMAKRWADDLTANFKRPLNDEELTTQIRNTLEEVGRDPSTPGVVEEYKRAYWDHMAHYYPEDVSKFPPGVVTPKTIAEHEKYLANRVEFDKGQGKAFEEAMSSSPEWEKSSSGGWNRITPENPTGADYTTHTPAQGLVRKTRDELYEELYGSKTFRELGASDQRIDPELRDFIETAKTENWPRSQVERQLKSLGYNPADFGDMLGRLFR